MQAKRRDVALRVLWPLALLLPASLGPMGCGGKSASTTTTGAQAIIPPAEAAAQKEADDFMHKSAGKAR